MNTIYFDNAATTRITADALKEYCNTATNFWGNPSSIHSAGIEAHKLLEKTRKNFGDIMHINKEEVFFNSGGSEGNNLAIFNWAETIKRKGGNVVTTRIEHPSVMNCFKELEKHGIKVSYIDIDREGRADINQINDLLNEDTALISVMQVNNETGHILPIEAIADIKQRKCPEALFHVDGVQGFGKHFIELTRSSIDVYTTSAHKLHGPRGVGVIYVSDRLKKLPFVFGGGQEKNLRSGTENLSGICAFYAAAHTACSNIEENFAHVTMLNERLRDGITAFGEKCTVLSPESGSPYILNISFKNAKSEVILNALSERGIFVSAGSACSANSKKNHVLSAMGYRQDEIDGAIRISFSYDNTLEEVDYTIQALDDIIKKLFFRRRK